MAKMWPFKSFQIFTKNWFLLNQSCNLLLFPPPLLLFPPLALHQLQPSQCLLLCPAPQCTALYPFFTTSELLRTVSGNQQYSALCCYGMSGYVWAADKTSAKLIQPSIALSDAAQQWTFSSEFWQKQPFVWFIDCLAQLQYSPELKKNFSVCSSTFAIFFFHLANAFQRSNSAPNILPRVEKRELRGWVESFDILIVPLPSSFLRPPKNLRPRPRLPWHHDGWALHSWSIFIISSSLPKPCPTTGPARIFFFWRFSFFNRGMSRSKLPQQHQCNSGNVTQASHATVPFDNAAMLLEQKKIFIWQSVPTSKGILVFHVKIIGLLVIDNNNCSKIFNPHITQLSDNAVIIGSITCTVSVSL